MLERRAAQLNLRLTAHELARLEQAAQAVGLRPGSYVRGLALQGRCWCARGQIGSSSICACWGR